MDLAVNQAFDATVEKCRKQWQDKLEMQAVLEDCREVIDEVNNDGDGDGETKRDNRIPDV